MDVRTLWKQLPARHFFRVVSASAARRILDANGAMIYGQSGEDAVIWRLLDHKRPGFYVDVGAHDPVKFSNTYKLYLQGWSGIAIDANEEFAQCYRRHRPKDIFVSALVTDCPGERNFNIYADRALSSTSEKKVFESPDQYRVERKVTMIGRTLQDILVEYNVPLEFDFLSIDVENHDMEVLRSFDLSQFRPNLIGIEVHDADGGRIRDCEAAIYLGGHGYRAAAYIASNVFFLKGAR